MKIYLLLENKIPVKCFTDIKNVIDYSNNLSNNQIIPIDLEFNKELLDQLAINVIDNFEDVLSDKGIIIPCEDREENEEEACIYGDVYYNLEDDIKDTIMYTLENNTELEQCITLINKEEK